MSTTGALVNNGDVELINNGSVELNLGYGDGGSSLTVAGTITNNKYLLIGDAGLSASDKITAASLDNTGNLGLQGAGANHALLDVARRRGFRPGRER